MQFCHFCVTLILIWLIVLNFPNTNAARGNPSKLLPPPRTSHNSPSALTQTPPSVLIIFVITAARGGPGKIAVQGHPSPSAHSAVGQNPPSGSRQVCSTKIYGSCMAEKTKPVACSAYNRDCGRN
ncbi:uncharacterized protein LOC116000824 isoform X1 [Ipomoea triloba]|uniref:uncharacterized protein LOC116000824 isoform X1 n=1 Tax=Ipomoea triloba TaxID=35885 RepID=UPI00125E3573|nr:uncharacterized protein LOC116000824 isoform X1 [Ipomoea triloba]